MAYNYDRTASAGPVEWRKVKELSLDDQVKTLKPIQQKVERDLKKVRQTIARAQKELEDAKKDEAELSYDLLQISDHLAIIKHRAR